MHAVPLRRVFYSPSCPLSWVLGSRLTPRPRMTTWGCLRHTPGTQLLPEDAMRRFFAGLVAAAVVVPALAAEAPPKIDPTALAKTVQDISSDAFEGRGTGSAAEPKVIDYIVTQFK